jgi:hypothetical protein
MSLDMDVAIFILKAKILTSSYNWFGMIRWIEDIIVGDNIAMGHLTRNTFV